MMTAPSIQPLRGTLRHQEPMSRHTSWRIGGPAERYYEPADVEDLMVLLAQLAPDEAVTWLGLGSNVLVRDAGIRGTVIATAGLLNDMQFIQNQQLYVQAGVSCAKVAREAARQALTGAAFFAGIPGTVGGALAMNAGAFGGETWGLVTAVETVDRHGQRHLRNADEFETGYRTVIGRADEWFIAAYLQLASGDTQREQQDIRALLKKRAETQPTQQPSCGSVFRNPEGDHAARLIEACGLKGTCRGKACVSEKHANFILNTGAATAQDVELLIEYVQQQVQQQTGVSLQTEVRIIGEHNE